MLCCSRLRILWSVLDTEISSDGACDRIAERERRMKCPWVAQRAHFGPPDGVHMDIWSAYAQVVYLTHIQTDTHRYIHIHHTYIHICTAHEIHAHTYDMDCPTPKSKCMYVHVFACIFVCIFNIFVCILYVCVYIVCMLCISAD